MDAPKKPQSFAACGQVLKDIWKHLSKDRKRQAFFLGALMLVGGFAEAASLGLVLPFLAAMAAPQKVISHPVTVALSEKIQQIAEFCSGEKNFPISKISSEAFVTFFALLFIAAAVFAGGIRLLLLWSSVRLASRAGTDLGSEVYRRTLFQPYGFHVTKNSSTLISNLTTKLSLTTVTLTSWLTLFTSFVIFAFLIGTLCWISLGTTIGVIVVVGASYGAMTTLSHRKLKTNSHILSKEQNLIIKFLQEGLGGIRDILLDGTQDLYAELYRKADATYRRANAKITIIKHSPRFIMESVGMVVFAGLALVLSRSTEGLASFIPILGALVLGVQRILPVLQQGYQAWGTILAYQDSNREVLRLLNQPLMPWTKKSESGRMPFLQNIRFEEVSFRYLKNTSMILERLSFTIAKGTRVAFVGQTGCGKSTCLDLLMGLLEPNQGKILIDGNPLDSNNLRAWQRNISHVPQAIYLADTSLAENIAFGVPAHKIDLNRVREAARKAQIADFIESSPGGYQAQVGERGIRLSGGQRQRIGIARALYKQSQVLVFDEATSALDQKTEESVMTEINSLGPELTILIISHRPFTIKNCAQIIDLDKTPPFLSNRKK